MKNVEKTNIKLSLSYFVSIAMIGVLLRWYSVDYLPIDYKGFLHAHSHIAFLGWIYIAFIVIINRMYIPAEKLNSKKYLWISVFTHITLLGILISFPIQSYGFFSILFLSLFLISTYFYVCFFRKNKQVNGENKISFSYIKSALFFMLLSSVAPWFIGLIIKLFGKGSVIYNDGIYFYLHFQYNGWFLFALLGIVLFFIEKNGVKLSVDRLKRILYLLILSTFLSYFSNVLWSKPSIIFNAIAFVGVVGEWLTIFLLLRLFYEQRQRFKKSLSGFHNGVLWIVFSLLLVKVSLQIFQIFPYFAEVSYQIRNFIIGYLHLLMLGIFTPFLFIMLHYFKIIRLPKLWFIVFFTGFVLNEILLFSQAILLWCDWKIEFSFPIGLLIASLLMLVGVFAVFLRNLFLKDRV